MEVLKTEFPRHSFFNSMQIFSLKAERQGRDSDCAEDHFLRLGQVFGVSALALQDQLLRHRVIAENLLREGGLKSREPCNARVRLDCHQTTLDLSFTATLPGRFPEVCDALNNVCCLQVSAKSTCKAAPLIIFTLSTKVGSLETFAKQRPFNPPLLLEVCAKNPPQSSSL